MENPTVGVVGVGQIGSWFTKKLLHAEISVTVYDIDDAAVTSMTEIGATAAATPSGVAAGSDVTLLSLPGRPYVESVMEADDGVLDALNGGEVVIDTGTSPPEIDKKYARLCAERDAGYLDAPLTWGGPGEFDEETGPAFTMFVGGDREQYERVKPVLDVLAHQHDRFGDSGSGHVVKAAHRMRQNCRAAVDWEFTELLRDSGVNAEEVKDLLELDIREALFNDEYPSVAGFDAAIRGENDSGEESGIPVEDTQGGVRLRTSEWAKDPGYALSIAHSNNTYAPILSTVYQTQLAAENYASALFEREIEYSDPMWEDRTAAISVYRRLNRPAEEWRRLVEQADND